ERHTTIVPAVGREEHDGNSTSADLVDDLVRPDANALKDCRHHRPRRTSVNQLSRLRTARSGLLRSPKASRLTSWKTFPVNSGFAPSSMMNDRRTRSDVPFR